MVFAAGIIGTGLLAVPVLAGSAAYALGEALGWPTGLGRLPLDAKAFYAAIVVSTLVGIGINFVGIDPIKALFWTAVLNGVIAVPLMVVMMVMARDPQGDGALRAAAPALGHGLAVHVYHAGGSWHHVRHLVTTGACHNKKEDCPMLEIRRMGPQIGVEITGVDVKTLDDAGFAPIYQAWLDHNVIVRARPGADDPAISSPTAAASARSRRTRRNRRAIRTFRRSRCSASTNSTPTASCATTIYRRGAEGWHTDGAYDADAVQGDPALRAGGAEPRRQHAVRQHVRRL